MDAAHMMAHLLAQGLNEVAAQDRQGLVMIVSDKKGHFAELRYEGRRWVVTEDCDREGLFARLRLEEFRVTGEPCPVCGRPAKEG